MEKDDFLIFEEEDIQITLKNKYYYGGRIINLSESALILEDIKIGKILIAFDSIEFVRFAGVKE